MPSYNKSFNFRNGVQVDEDNFIVNPNGLVGIGTSIPTEFLDIHGTAKITGLVTARNLAVTGVSTFFNNVKISGDVTATTFFGSAAGLTGIFAISTSGWNVNAGTLSTASKVGIGTALPSSQLDVVGGVTVSGIVTATSFSGSGVNITNLNAAEIVSGTLNNSRLPQNINVSGIVTATSFSGSGVNITNLNATEIVSGTLNNSRLPQSINISGTISATSGIITSLTNTNLNNTGIATLGIVTISQLYVSGVTTSLQGFVGNVTGIASTARSLTGTPNITVSNITSTNINNSGISTLGNISSSNINNVGIITSLFSSIGISTVSERLYAESIGVGTDSPSSDIHIRRSSASMLQVTSDTAEAIIAVGRSTTLTGSNGALIFGNTFGIYPYSNSRTLDIVNYDTGNLNYYLNYSTGSGNIGDFNWIYTPGASNPLMTLTYGGNLGIGITDPTDKLDVDGSVIVRQDLNVSQNLNVDQDIVAIGAGSSVSVDTLYVYGGKSQILNSDGTKIFPPEGENENVNITSGISTFFDINVDNNVIVGAYIGIRTTNPLYPIQVGVEDEFGEFVSISEDGIGLGHPSIDSGFFLNAGTKKACFGLVSVGTTEDIIDVNTSTTICYVEGDSEFNGNVGIGTTIATSALTVIGDTLVTGVTTSQNGFTSGIGVTNPVQITVSENILTFNVIGVGSTSLLLY